jgi:hypothetical protein
MLRSRSAILNLTPIIKNNPRCGSGQRCPQKIWGRLPAQPCPAFSFLTERSVVIRLCVYSVPSEPDNFTVPHLSFFRWSVPAENPRNFLMPPLPTTTPTFYGNYQSNLELSVGLIWQSFIVVGPPLRGQRVCADQNCGLTIDSFNRKWHNAKP